MPIAIRLSGWFVIVYEVKHNTVLMLGIPRQCISTRPQFVMDCY